MTEQQKPTVSGSQNRIQSVGAGEGSTVLAGPPIKILQYIANTIITPQNSCLPFLLSIDKSDSQQKVPSSPIATQRNHPTIFYKLSSSPFDTQPASKSQTKLSSSPVAAIAQMASDSQTKLP